MKIWTYPVLFLTILWTCQNSEDHSPDKIIFNVKVWSERIIPGDAVSIQADTIVRVGRWDDMKTLAGATTELIDGQGGLLIPGFIDSHVHLRDGAQSLISVQLRDASTPAEFIRKLGEFAKGRDSSLWILGGVWNHELWGGELPSRHWIDSVTGMIPVFVNRLDGHMALANSAAIKLAGLALDDLHLFVEGGDIIRDMNGLMTGIFKDNAMDLIYRSIPALPASMEDLGLDSAQNYLLRHGVTSVHHMGTWHDVLWLEKAKREGRLDLRIYACTPLAEWDQLAKRLAVEGQGDAWLKVGGLKGFMDGSLGSHTASFFEDYIDKKRDKGFLINTEENMSSWIRAADSAGLQCVIHAIGDRANHLLLNIFESLDSLYGPRDRRYRIEHAQHLKAEDIQRIGQLSIIPSMQPYHAIDDGCWAEKLIGSDRCKTTYAFRSMLDAGATLAFGSDWYVAPADPLAGIAAAVHRQTLDGKHTEGWYPEQKITVEEALRAYTVNAAYSVFEEGMKGQIKTGYLADLVLLSQDILQPQVDIDQAQILWTMVGGMIKYQLH